jgi:hypothetical protein
LCFGVIVRYSAIFLPNPSRIGVSCWWMVFGVACWWMVEVWSYIYIIIYYYYYILLYIHYYIIYYTILLLYIIILYIILYSSLLLFSPPLPFPISHSFYTCRYLHILIYIIYNPLPPNNSDPAQIIGGMSRVV